MTFRAVVLLGLLGGLGASLAQGGPGGVSISYDEDETSDAVMLVQGSAELLETSGRHLEPPRRTWLRWVLSMLLGLTGVLLTLGSASLAKAPHQRRRLSSVFKGVVPEQDDSRAPVRNLGDEQFDTAGTGASNTYPMQADAIRKGGYIIIKERPCKVTDISTSKTGKHGHAKCHIEAVDIFTGETMEDLVPSEHNVEVPIVVRKEYTCSGVDDEGSVILATDDGETEWLPLPKATELSNNIKNLLNENKDFVVIVLSAMGTEQIIDIKTKH